MQSDPWLKAISCTLYWLLLLLLIRCTLYREDLLAAAAVPSNPMQCSRHLCCNSASYLHNHRDTSPSMGHHAIIRLCPLSKVASMRIFSVFSMLQLVLHVMHFSTGGAIPSYWMQLSAISPNCSITTFFSAHTATGHEQLQMESR